MEAFFQILSNFGFPIALSCYLLLRLEKILDSLQKTNSDLVNKNIELIKEVIELQGLIDKRKK